MLPTFAKPLLAVGLLAGGFVLLRALPRVQALSDRLAQRASHPASASAADTPERADLARSERARSTCALTRARIARGASVGPADGEGWLVALVLVRDAPGPDMTSSAALADFVALTKDQRKGRFVWDRTPRLSKLERFDAEVAVEPVSIGTGAYSGPSGVELRFNGPYVAPYFNEAERGDFLLIANALSERLGATSGALFARCAGGAAHDIGAWFLGKSPGSALGSLVYFMLSFDNPGTFRQELLGPEPGKLERGFLFHRIADATDKLERTQIATWIGAERGMLAGRPNRPVELTFPFRDANRATRAALVSARTLGLTYGN